MDVIIEFWLLDVILIDQYWDINPLDALEFHMIHELGQFLKAPTHAIDKGCNLIP